MITLSYEQIEDIGLKYVRDLLEPASPYGVKYLKNEGFYGPGQQHRLEEELDNVALLVQALREAGTAVADLQHGISFLKDLSGTFRNLEHQPLTEVELFELTAFCRRMQALIPLAEKLPGYSDLKGIAFVSLEEALSVLDPTSSGGISFYVEDGRSPDLASCRRRKREAEAALRRADGPERVRLLQQRQEAAAEEEEALKAIYASMSRALRPFASSLQKNAEAVGRLDAALAKAVLASRFQCVKPQIGGETLLLEEAVHLRAARDFEARGRSFTPISVSLERGVSVLTGANMGGKSIALKTVLQNAALALSGCFVFARYARVPYFARMEIINRDFSDASRGLSSFGGEMLRLQEALDNLKQEGLSLIVMDEPARGTNAREGAVIVRSIIRYLQDKNAVTFLATHYDGAAGEAGRHYQVKGLQRMSQAAAHPAEKGLDGLRLIEQAMDYGLIQVPPGTECPRDALRICRMLGLQEVLLREEEEL